MNLFSGRRPSMRDISTQYDDRNYVATHFSGLHSFTPQTISTTSSSQTETNLFMPKTLKQSNKLSVDACEHVDANVIRIQLGAKESDATSSNEISTQIDIRSSLSGESSSIPSSYEQKPHLKSTAVLRTTDNTNNKGLNTTGLGDVSENNVKHQDETDDIPPLRKHSTIPVLPSSSPSHNRARRGGIIPKESDAVVHAAVTLSKPRAPVMIIQTPSITNQQSYNANKLMKPPSNNSILVNSSTMEELEIQSRTPRNDGTKLSQLQSMPDSIMRVSISS